MLASFSHIDEFYKSEIGQIASQILSESIKKIWPDMHSMSVMGAGFAMPYIEAITNGDEERVFCVTPFREDVAHWPSGRACLLAQADDNRLPFEHSSIDRILLVHYVENTNHLRKTLREIWRVLKPNGKLMVIVPNRMGMWARSEWSPWGHGQPFSQMQIVNVLKDNLLYVEGVHSGLFVPPIPDSPVIMRSAHLIERFGQSILPFVAGVHLVEVSKQVYARADQGGSGAAVLAKTKEFLSGGGKPSTIPQSCKPRIGKSENKGKDNL